MNKLAYLKYKIFNTIRGQKTFIGYDFANGQDYSCVVYGKKKRDGTVEIDAVDFLDGELAKKLAKKILKIKRPRKASRSGATINVLN